MYICNPHLRADILIFNFYVIYSMEIQFITFHCSVDVFHGGRTGDRGVE